MWTADVAKHAQDALAAAHSGSHPDWHIRVVDASTRRMIRSYISQAYRTCYLDDHNVTNDDFEFYIITNLVSRGRRFSVYFDRLEHP